MRNLQPIFEALCGPLRKQSGSQGPGFDAKLSTYLSRQVSRVPACRAPLSFGVEPSFDNSRATCLFKTSATMGIN